MLRFFLGVVGAVSVGACSAAMAQVPHFEGPITYQVTPAQGLPYTVTYLIKGTKMRFEVPQNTGAQLVPVSAAPDGGSGADMSGLPGGSPGQGAPTAVLTVGSSGGAAVQTSSGPAASGTPTEVVDWSTGNGFTFVSALRSYTPLSSPDDSIASAHISTVQITKAATKETIAGLSCDDYTLTDTSRPDTTAILCVASHQGIVMSTNGPVRNVEAIPLSTQFASEHFRQTGFLVLKYTTLVQGKPAGQFVAVSAKHKLLTDDLFSVPDGYRSTDSQ